MANPKVEHFSQYFEINFVVKIPVTKLPRLPQHCRDQAIGMLEAGISVNMWSHGASAVPEWLFISCNGGTGILVRTQDRPRSGRPRVTTPIQDRRIRLLHLRDRFRSATDYGVQRPLAERITESVQIQWLDGFAIHGLRPRRPYISEWCWTIADGRDVAPGPIITTAIIGDFKTGAAWYSVMNLAFNFTSADGRQRVYRRIRRTFRQMCRKSRWIVSAAALSWCGEPFDLAGNPHYWL